MKLFAGPVSGNSYKVRILLGLLGLPYELVLLSLGQHQHKSAAFRRLSPRGQVPVLVDDGHVFWDSAGCLMYLAGRYGGSTWLPDDPVERANIVQWLSLAASELQFGLQYARRGVIRNRWIAGDLAQLQAIGRLGLQALETRLGQNDWLCLDHVTIADIACFPYVDSAPEANLDLDDYPGVVRWLARCRMVPGWVSREIDPLLTTPFEG